MKINISMFCSLLFFVLLPFHAEFITDTLQISIFNSPLIFIDVD